MVASGGVLGEFGGNVVGGQASCELTEVIVAGAVRSGGRSQLGIRWFYEQREVGTMEIEQAVAAGRAVGEVGFDALIFQILIVRTPIFRLRIIRTLITRLLIYKILIVQTLIIDALMLVTLGRFRSRTGRSIPVVFNLSTAQMLRLFSHWTHISLI